MSAETWEILFSERLGALTDVERRLERDPSVRLTVASLRTERELLENAGRAHVIVVGAIEPVTASVLARLPQLRAVVRRGIGVDNVDVGAASKLGIPVAYVPAATVEEVSDHALALALTLARRIPQIGTAVRVGDNTESARLGNETRRFTDMTLGIVGFGRIGRAMARKSGSVFGGIIAYDPLLEAGTTSDGVELVDLDALLARSDVISLHAPSTPDTPAIINAESLASMRPGVLIVNTARGQLIDEAALIEAIAGGHVGGAALDVTAIEPLPLDSPLLDCEQILVTGHTASKGASASLALRTAVVAAVESAISGRDPEFLADPGVIDSRDYRLGSAATHRKGH